LKLSRRQRAKLWLFGHVSIGYEKREGWRKEKEIYVCNCPIHGLYSGPTHGWDNADPQCPGCIQDAIKRWPDILESERVRRFLNVVTYGSM